VNLTGAKPSSRHVALAILIGNALTLGPTTTFLFARTNKKRPVGSTPVRGLVCGASLEDLSGAA
jgi:hypothetical protein